MKHVTSNEQATAALAQELAQTLKKGDILLLYGPLGAGKSVFSRTLIRVLTGDCNMDIPSPTFTLLQTYEGKTDRINHYDFYRLRDPEEVLELDWEESLANSITIAEWPERLGHLIPARRLDIRFTTVKNKPDVREIEITRIE